jgi:teichuronic acid exporter
MKSGADIESDRLLGRARRGWAWGGLDQFVQRGIGLIVAVVLARMLEPSAFGLIASVTIFIAVAQQLIDGGIAQRILQKPTIEAADYEALFWCNTLMSAACVVVLAALARPVALFFDEDKLAPILVALAVSLFLMNAGRVQAIRMIRELKFKAVSLITIVSVVAGCVTGLLMAAWGFGVWALIGQQMMTGAVRASVYWLVMPMRFAWPASFERSRELYAHGLPVMCSEVARAIADLSINFLIAKRISAAALGYYDRGRIVPQNIAYSLSNLFLRTNLPVLSKVQSDDVAFRDTYLRLIGSASAISFMLMAAIIITAQDLVVLLLGARWLPSALFMQASALAFCAYAIFASASEVLRAKGLPGVYFRCNLLCAGLQLTGILAGMRWGAQGMVAGDVCGRAAACIPMIIAVSRMARVSVWDQVRVLTASVGGALLMALALWLVGLLNWSLYPQMLAYSVAGATVLGGYLVLERRKTA